MNVVKLTDGRHLGDALTVLNLIYSRNIETKEKTQIYGPSLIADLLAIFDYKSIEYLGNSRISYEQENTTVVELMPKIYSGPLSMHVTNQGFLGSRMCYINFDKMYKPTKVHLPLCKISSDSSKNNVLYFQFDTRSPGPNKPRITAEHCVYYINKYKESTEHQIGIGGFGTPSYVSFEFHIGNLFHITRNLLSCKKFVGIDSGISHLAGTLNVKGDVVIHWKVDSMINELTQFYNVLYPSLKTQRPIIERQFRMV